MHNFLNVPRISAILISGFVLIGLSACEEGASVNTASSLPAASVGSTVEQDVERADIFSVSEDALWDGRPSLGGVWVAYPGNIDPERVLITNVATGDSVIGALFRRERENPGPAIQLSSDAASSLGVLAGSPTEISIVVLRRETVEIAPPPEPEIEMDPEIAEIGDIVVETLADIPVAAPVVAPVAAPVGRAPVADAEPVVDTEPTVEAESVAPAPAGPPPSKPFIQIATFTAEQNAQDLVTILGNEGVQAEIRTDATGERTLYRVVSGPATSKAERDERLRIIKSLGFTDAFIFG